jgi:hypothetical protein
MSLKFILDQAGFDGLQEPMKALYEQKGDSFNLLVEGAVEKGKLDEFRQTNVELLKQQEAFKGVDLAKYKLLEEQERKLRDKELIDKKDFDGLINERTNSMKSDYEAKLQALKADYDGLSTNHHSIINKYEIEGASSKAFTAHKIDPDMHEAVTALIKSKFVVDNNQVIAKNGDSIELGANGNLTIDEFVSSLPERFKIQSSGGNGQGNKATGSLSNDKSSRQKITDGLSKLLK